MTYQAYETSDQDGKPVSFYEIQWGATIWRYTSADRDITISQIIGGVPTDVLYTAVTCWDDGVRQGGDSNADITIHLPSNIPMADLFQSTPPTNTIRISVRRRQHNDPDGQAFIYWKGYLANVKRDEGNAAIVVIGNTLLASFTRQGLRLGWTRGCTHVLYDNQCRVDPADFLHTTTIAAMDGNSVTMASAGGHPLDWFSGGYIEWDAAAGTPDRRGISGQTSTTRLLLLGTTYRLAIGMTIRVYPGCHLTMHDCRHKFFNRENYGGCLQMSGKNPFDGTPII